MAQSPTSGGAKKESFYDAAFSIEGIQHEPCESGFTWRTVLGALFVAFVMLPGVIFMGLMIGQDLGTAAEWVTIILFVELARRSFVALRKQELYILKYTVGHLSHIVGSMALGGGVFASLVWQRYLRHSEAFRNFDIAHEVPSWYAPVSESASYRGFLDGVWLPVIGVLVGSMVLSKLTQLSLGYLAYKLTADVERLPFPLAPIHAEGAIALAERSQDVHKKGFRQHYFSIGIILGAAFGLLYVGIPTLSQAVMGKPLQLIPIPFLDLTKTFQHWLHGGTFGICLNMGLLFTGFVLPWRIVVGMFTTTMVMQLIVNPILQSHGFFPHWQPDKDAIETHVAVHLDLYLSVGIGTAFAIFFVGLFGLVKSVIRYRRQAGNSDVDLRRLFHRDRDRGDPPTWVALAVWAAAAGGFVVLSDHLVNHGIPEDQQFSRWWLIGFAFLWTPINTYINARMVGIAGQHAGLPYVFESAVFISGYEHVKIWFAPLPLSNFGNMADTLRVCQLTRTKFTSILKAELLIFPLMLVASFLFWSYICSLGPIPSDSYPYVQKFWPQHAQMKALWAASKQEGQSLLLQSLKVKPILFSLVGAVGLFGLFGAAGISTQYLYGGLTALNGYPHYAIMIFMGACLGRFYFARKFGREKWMNYAPILAVGFGAGMGLTGMLSIALNFLWVSIGTGF